MDDFLPELDEYTHTTLSECLIDMDKVKVALSEMKDDDLINSLISVEHCFVYSKEITKIIDTYLSWQELDSNDRMKLDNLYMLIHSLYFIEDGKLKVMYFK